jgi:outer membrane lipoprotein-sorting protein
MNRQLGASLISFLFLSTLSQISFAAEPTAQELLKGADHHRGLQSSFSANVRALVQDGDDKSESIYSVKVQDNDNSLVEQISPERSQGRKLLMKGLDMWLFTPQVKKPVRISLQQRLTGEIANGDISRTNYAQDYDATIASEDAALKAKVLDLTAKDKRVTYHKIKYWVEKGSMRPLKAEFYALSGKLMKTATFSEFKKVEGQDIMTKVLIQDALVEKKRSILIYSKQKLEKFSDSLFNKEQMDR